MDQLFAELDTQCPETLFTFLANAEDMCGQLTQFAIPLARHFESLEDLQKATPLQVQRAGEAVGMPQTGVDAILEHKSKPDSRFDHPVVAPPPRWSLIIGEVFDILDADKNGTVDLGEYLAMGSHLAGAFMMNDKSGTGAINKTTFLAVHLNDARVIDGAFTETELESMAGAMKKYLLNRTPLLKTQIDREGFLTVLFQAFDFDGDGEIDWMEMQQYSTNMEMAMMMDMLYNHMDAVGNKDGVIQLGEWVTGFSQLTQQMSDEQFEPWLMSIVHHIKSVRAAADTYPGHNM